MNYIETKIYTNTVGIEAVSAVLISCGIESYVTEDKNDILELMDKKNTYDWDYIDDSLVKKIDEETVITVYLEDTDENRKSIEEVTVKIEGLRESDAEGTFGKLFAETKLSSDDDWKDNWKEYFKPAKITEQIVVKPTWEEYTPLAGESVIEIDPGMAFGTGMHETTSLCMKLLEKNLLISGKSVLDVGSGSGILSIAAAMLGAEEVLGIEIDPVAVDVSRQNVELNGLSNKISIIQGDLTKGLNRKFDIVAANLMADLVIMLSESVAEHMNDGGVFISSGILVEKKQIVSEAIIKAGFEITESPEDGEWCAISAKYVRKDDN